MSAGKYLKVIWMYAIGLALVFIGLYVISFMTTFASSGPLGFGLMITGLLFSTVGGIYGKKKLLETSGEKLPAVETKQIDQLKQNVVSQLKPPETSADPPADPPQAPVQPKPEFRPQVVIKPPMQSAQQPAQPSPAPVEGVLKIMVCPDCSTENPPSNMFCSKCGKRLRKPEAAAPHTAAAPRARKARVPRPKKKAAKKKAPAIPVPV